MEIALTLLAQLCHTFEHTFTWATDWDSRLITALNQRHYKLLNFLLYKVIVACGSCGSDKKKKNSISKGYKKVLELTSYAQKNRR